MYWAELNSLPTDFTAGCAVILNNEIHILGTAVGYPNKHYKYSNGSWILVSTLPYNFYYGSAVVLNNEIHILGGRESRTAHCKYSNGIWTSVSTLPYGFSSGQAVILNNEIHILGGSESSQNADHYKYSNGSWIEDTPFPFAMYRFYNGSAVILNDEIHALGGTMSTKYHYKYSNGSWIEVSTLPYNFHYGAIIIYNNEIHILGGSTYNGTVNSTKHYKYSNGSWIEVSILPYDFIVGCAIIFDNKIHILGSSTPYYRAFYEYQLSNNKVTFGNEILLDLSQDTVTKDDVMSNKYFHDFMGTRQLGNIVSKTPSDTSPPSVSVGDSIYAASSGYLSQTIQTPQIIFECSGGGCQTATSYTHNEFSDTQHLDTNYVHYDANGDIVIDKAMPNGYIYGNTQQGRDSSGNAVYGSLDIRVNGTSQLTLAGSSSSTAPTGTVSVSLAVGDVVSVYSKCSKTGTTRCKFQMNIRTAAPPA